MVEDKIIKQKNSKELKIEKIKTKAEITLNIKSQIKMGYLHIKYIKLQITMKNKILEYIIYKRFT